jgi:DNA-binding transcriptional regulator YbjK
MSDRRTLIADATIATLAREGSRGLTHRAVDRTAGLPPGSTSYYIRTRAGLLEAAVTRLAQLDAATLPVRGDLVDALTEVLTAGLGEGRERQLARYELTLEAARRPELREPLAAGRRGLAALLAGLLAEHGVGQAPARADDFLALADGLLLGEVSGTHESTGSRLRDAVARFVAAAHPREPDAPAPS